MYKEVNFLILVILTTAFAMAVLSGLSSLFPEYKPYIATVLMGVCFVFGMRLRYVCDKSNLDKGIMSVSVAVLMLKKSICSK